MIFIFSFFFFAQKTKKKNLLENKTGYGGTGYRAQGTGHGVHLALCNV